MSAGKWAGAVGSLVVGMVSAVAALFDPAFLIAHPDLALSIGFSVFRGGQELRPGLPWREFMLVLVALSLVLSLAKIRKRRMEDN